MSSVMEETVLNSASPGESTSEARVYRIGDVVEKITGGCSTKKTDYISDGVLVLNKGHIKGYGIVDIGDKERFVSDKYASANLSRVVKKDTVLVTLRDLSVKADFLGLIGTYKKNQDALITQGMYALALSKEIYAPYLVYYSNSPGYRAHVKRNKIGSTQVHLRNGQFLDIKIPLPEVEQQKRIVAKTEELFSHIDAGIEALKKAKQLLKQYRQSVLKAGFSGVLTSEATNGEELPIGWKKIELGKISTDVSYGYTASSSKDAIGPKMLRITDIQDNKVIWDDVPYCEIAESAVSKYLLDTNDIVFARTGATVGKSFLIEGEIPCSVYASYLIRVRLKENIDPKYISLFFHTSDYWYQIKKNQSGIGQPNVNGTKLKKLAVTLAPYESQKKIVSIIEEKLSSIEHLESEIDQQLIKAERNKQAVLASAFSGNLMETEA